MSPWRRPGSSGGAAGRPGGRPADPATWPALGTRVTLAEQGPDSRGPRPTRVEDTDAAGLAVGAPRGAKGELEPPLDGAPYDLTWPGDRGLLAMPVVLRRRAHDQVALWWLDPTGPVAVQQRRSYVRAAVDAPFPVRVTLEWELPERGSAAGELEDLSEGGLRVHLRMGPDAVEVPEGGGVSVRMTLVDAGFGEGSGSGAGVDVVEHELFGTVLRAGRLPQSPEVTEAVVQLHDDAGQGDALRRLVFAWQRRTRQR